MATQQGITPSGDDCPATQERTQAVEALRWSEAVLAQAGKLAHLGAWELELSVSARGEVSRHALRWSDEVYRIFGYEPGSVAVTNELFFGHAHPEDRPQITAAVERALTDRQPYSLEHRIIRADGAERIVLEYAEIVPDAGGGAARMIGAVQDITERKQAEAVLRETEDRLRVLTNNLPHVMVYQVISELDGRQRFSYVSASVTALHEISVEAVLADETLLYRQIDPDLLPTLLAAEAESKSSLGMFRMETRFRLPSGRVRWAELASTPRRLADGRVAWDGVEVDITARKKAEKERLELERQMLHAQKLESLGVMAGGIAHDFNNLLMGVLGNLELAALRLGPEPSIQTFLGQATLAANRAADLTRQILAYSGRGRFVVKAVNLSELVLENVHMLKTAISKRVELEVRPAPDLPAIQADPGQLQQVVMNLITNAAEAIGPGDGVVRITTGAGHCDEQVLGRTRTEEPPAPGWFVWLEVSDTGCGMDPETQQRLFDPFFSTKFTGRGLGLAAVLGIVRGHHGAILLESSPGRGSIFRVLFPAAPSE